MDLIKTKALSGIVMKISLVDEKNRGFSILS